MKKRILLVVLAIILVCATAIGCSAKKEENSIVVGAKDYTEQDVLGNLLTLLISNNTDLKVSYVHEMSSNVLFAALQSGDVDVCSDYTGTIYANYLGYMDSKDAGEVYRVSVDDMKEKYGLLVLDPVGFNNTYCIAVRPDTAAEFGLRTFTDLANVSQDLIFGGGFEILNRIDGLPGVKELYNMSFKQELAIESVLRYTAIANDETQVTEAFSTDGMLMEYELVVLEDDLNFFPPYQGVPVIRADTAAKYPELLDVLAKLTGLLNDDSMRELNYKVDVLKQEPRSVAEGFLKEKGLI